MYAHGRRLEQLLQSLPVPRRVELSQQVSSKVRFVDGLLVGHGYSWVVMGSRGSNAGHDVVSSCSMVLMSCCPCCHRTCPLREHFPPLSELCWGRRTECALNVLWECAERSKYPGISTGLQPSNLHLERWRRNLIQLCFQWLACFCCEYWKCEGPISLIPYLNHISVVDSGEQSAGSWCSGHGHGCRKAFRSQAQWDLDPPWPVATTAWPFRRCVICIRHSNLAGSVQLEDKLQQLSDVSCLMSSFDFSAFCQFRVLLLQFYKVMLDQSCPNWKQQWMPWPCSSWLSGRTWSKAFYGLQKSLMVSALRGQARCSPRVERSISSSLSKLLAKLA